jgi:hypothetical protein
MGYNIYDALVYKYNPEPLFIPKKSGDVFYV